ncbi:MAG: cupin domain-containing protein [Thermodesulfobacteriota bacterium]
MTAEQLIARLRLKPLDIEGGYYFETFRSGDTVASEYLPERYKSDRCLSTAIYYLLTVDTKSRMHRILSDEIFHFYIGDPVQMLQLNPNGSSNIFYLGNEILSGQRPQVVVPGGVWQGSQLVEGGEFALMGTTVAPGFEFDEFEHGDRAELTEMFPQHKELIEELTL